MSRKNQLVLVAIMITAAVNADANAAGLSEYREALADAHGPFVAIPTYLGAALGAAALTPISLVYGTASLVLFRDNPARVAESWVTAPKRGWYWGGIVLGTPFRALKGLLWDAPRALFRAFRYRGEPREGATGW